MDVTNEYFNDNPDLRKKYYIAEEPGEYSKEAEFVADYRKKLFDMFNNYIKIIEVFGETSEQYKKTILYNLKSDALNLASVLQNFMSESNKDNIMRRLVFINNLHREFASVFEKSVNDLSTIFYDELEKDLKPIDKFLKFVCAYTLMHDGLIDKLQDELAADNLAMITGMIQENYLKYIDKDNLTEDDLYFIYGYALKQYESQEKITPDHCENCQKDDCTYCQYQYDSLSHDKLVKNYRLVKEAIGNKIMNPKYYDMQVTLMMINDVNLRELAPKIFDGHLSTRKRKFTFKSDKPSKIRLQKDKLLGKIEEKIGDGDKDIRTLNSDKLSTYILREFYEFENNEGMEIDKEFRDWYKSYFAKLDKSGHLIDLKVEGNINYNNLIDEFYQDCEDIKEMRR